MSRIARLILTASAAGVLACSQDSPTEPAELAGIAPELARGAPISRPAGGTCDTRIAFLPREDGQPDNVQVIRVDLDCNLRHLGRTTGVLIQRITSTGLTNTLTASTVYTAANGDLLNADFVGAGGVDPVALEVTFSGTETYTGGTGRFAGATGSASLSGIVSLLSNTGNYSTTGSLSY